MYMKGFRAPVTLRFARLELVRNQWRRYRPDLTDGTQGPNVSCNTRETALTVDNVNIEENSSRDPFNYVLPEGIQREQQVGVFNTLQNEQSLALSIEQLCNGAERAVFRVLNMDMRVYERFKMFVHAEEKNNFEIPEGATSIFIRMGSDFQSNYYEYEIPLSMSDPEAFAGMTVNPNSIPYKREVWRPENEFDFALSELIELKKRRNDLEFSLGEEFVENIPKPAENKTHRLKIKGNPNLGQVKVMMVGVRNIKDDQVFGEDQIPAEPIDMEVWINEMRLTGLDERGGAAATARVDAQLADFGSFTMAGNISTIGFGAIDQKVQERQREQVTGYDLALNLNLDKFLPERWGIRLPFFAQYSNNTIRPEFDPYDLDVRLNDKLSEVGNRTERDSILDAALEVSTIKSLNFTNVRKERSNNTRAAMPWDISNFSLSYSFTENDYRDPIIEFNREQKHVGALDYSFNRRTNYLEPFKGISSKWLDIISKINVNPLPNGFTFSSIWDRTFETTSYRFTDVNPRFRTFYNQRFTWDRDYDLQWDLTRSIKINFNATNSAVIDEPFQAALVEQFGFDRARQIRRDSVWENIKDFGRPKNYQHNISVGYNLPVRHLPIIGEFVTAKVQYNGGYNWTAAALNLDSLGNVIQNNQSRSGDVDIDLEKLYSQWDYLNKIQGRGGSRGRNRGRANPRSRRRPSSRDDQQSEEEEEGKDREPSAIEKALIRPLLSVRRVRLNFREELSTTLPGYMPETQLLGMTGFDSPGWDFVAGLQPRIRQLSDEQLFNPDPNNLEGDWLRQNEQWFSGSFFQNKDVQQTYSQRFEIRSTVEPIRDFRIDLEVTRNYRENYSEQFRDTVPGDGIRRLVHTVPYETGSMDISFSALSTLFRDSNDEITDLFDQFEENRIVISRRLGTGFHQDPNLAQEGYARGFGKTQQEVILPAFLAAYTGEDPNTVKLNLFDLLPKVNWRMQYNGLARIPFFQKIFQNFSISHGYRSNLQVNNFRTSLPFLDTRATEPLDTSSFNFFPRLEISDVVISENFSPLIALDMTLVNGMSFNFNYNKSRTLALSTVNYQLNESQSEELTLGFGYLVRGVDIPFLTGSKKKKDKDGEGGMLDNLGQGGRGNRRGGGRGLQSQDLDINFDMSIRDDVTFAHRLDENIVEPTRGSYTLAFSPAIEYQLNRSLSLRLFFDYRRTVPATSASFPRTNSSGGVVVRFQLN
jgi:cell surface protein SprA